MPQTRLKLIETPEILATRQGMRECASRRSSGRRVLAALVLGTFCVAVVLAFAAFFWTVTK